MTERRPTMRDALTRVHARVTLVAVSLSAITMLLVGYFAARTYAEQELQLTAQVAGYSAEAALVFDDRTALAEALTPLTRNPEIGALDVRGADGRVMFAWRSTTMGRHFWGEGLLGRLAAMSPVVSPILHDGRRVGEVRLVGSAEGVTHFLARGLISMLACLIVIALAARFLARRLQRTVADPLAAIARVAHEVRAERAFGRRVPGAEIAEIGSLGDDFNALLAELEVWQAHIKSEHETLAYRASHDPLTGLPNRASFEQQIARALEEAAGMGATVGLLYLDGDGFKAVNDVHGHAAGDAVLVELALRIQECLAPSDLVARLGGDEFVVLMTGADAAARAQPLANRIGAMMADAFALPGGEPIRLGLSVGIATFPADGRDAATLVRAADRAMYTVKQRRPRSGGAA